MPTLTVRNVEDATIDRLKRRAEAHRRSLEAEVREILAREAVVRDWAVPEEGGSFQRKGLSWTSSYFYLARGLDAMDPTFEVVGFAEEEGQRYKATFLGSGALIGDFQPEWLEQKDDNGVTMREAMQQAGLCVDDIPRLRRDPAHYLGFVEVHIEQGPVLCELDLPLGVVSSINGSVRYVGEMVGMASHAGTTPMDRRRDAAAGVAELALYVEQRAARDGDSVGTIGLLNVPGGSINVVPGRCQFSLDLRAPTDAQRDALAQDVLQELLRIAQRRGLRCVRVIHGKGHGSPGREPVLKGRVRRWLVQKNEVLAFVQARPAEGGAGAPRHRGSDSRAHARQLPLSARTRSRGVRRGTVPCGGGAVELAKRHHPRTRDRRCRRRPTGRVGRDLRPSR